MVLAETRKSHGSAGMESTYIDEGAAIEGSGDGIQSWAADLKLIE